MKCAKDYKELWKDSYNIRMNQAITPYGPGALVDFKDRTLMAASPYYWKSGTVIHDERLESSLGVTRFKMPTTIKNTPGKVDNTPGIPFVNFPKWYFCPKCREFKHLDKWEELYETILNREMPSPRCAICKVQLSPAGILTACENGHIQDFPWEEWVHLRGNQDICNKPQIKINVGSGTLGLEGLQVECTNCNSKRTLRGAFNKDVFENMKEEHRERFKCKGNMPWKGTNEDCDLYPKAIQRGGMNVYFSKIESSIVIPPYSDTLNVQIEQSNNYRSMLDLMKNFQEKNNIDQFKESLLNTYIEMISSEINVDEKQVEKIINRKLENKSDNEKNNHTREKYREEEYGALLGNISKSASNSKDFKIEHQNIDNYNIYGIKNVVLVKRLREVRALVGFTRLNPPNQTTMGISEEQDGKSKLVSLREKDSDWYPAYEVRGEGIFLEFDEKRIKEWNEKNPKVHERVSKLNKQYNNNEFRAQNEDRDISAKFVLLHTFAHLIMRELSFECGYSLASLRERIYCNTKDQNINMSGVLIYTADGDSEGSMGGLVEQGKSKNLTTIVQKALNRADWCSSDPTCITSNGQGRDSLNLAACYSCTLVPETSCEEFNGLLDRGLVVGTLDDESTGFFK